MKALIGKVWQVAPAVMRHLFGRNTGAYERILQYVRSKGDIWITTQGEYMHWWCERDALTLRVHVVDGQCHVTVSSPRAVIEQLPGGFLQIGEVACPAATFTGDVQITIDPMLPQKTLLIDLLKREGILNWRVAEHGEFMLSCAELSPLLEKIEADLHSRTRRTPGRPLEADVQAVRQIVAKKLAAHNLPLFRVWYHPLVNGIVPRAVFSPRYDVDRALTNLPAIRRLEKRYSVKSTLYIRSFCPFYTDHDVRAFAHSRWYSEIALHGEFITNVRRLGLGCECEAAKAEKEHLEQVIGRPVLGVGMHGGELTNNRSIHTDAAIQDAGFLYDTTPRPVDYYFPFRKVIGSEFAQSYGLAHALSDVNIPISWHYGQQFYQSAVAMMEEIYRVNGVFVLMLHPEYFGFFQYLAHPKNLFRLSRYLAKYLTGKTGSLS